MLYFAGIAWLQETTTWIEDIRTNLVHILVAQSLYFCSRLKTLFERRLVSRVDEKKPFVYELTEEGRRYLSAS